MRNTLKTANTSSSNGFVFISGVAPTVAETDGCVGGGVRKQLEQAFDNLKALLISSESDLNHLVSIQVIVPDQESSTIVDEVYLRKLSRNKPARSIVVGGSCNPSALIEINAVAVLSPDRVEKSLSEQLAQALAEDGENFAGRNAFKTAA